MLIDSGVIFRKASIGLPMKDAVEPVMANTINIKTVCRLDSIPQRSFSFFTFAI